MLTFILYMADIVMFLHFYGNIVKSHSLFFFSIVNAILVMLVLSILAVSINKMIKNKVVAFFTFLAVIFPTSIYCFIQNNSSYLQYMPHRVLFCSLIILFVNIYLKHRRTKCKYILQFIGFMISALAIFWNLETGIIVLIVWTAFLEYEILFYQSLKNKKTYIQTLQIIIMAILSVIASYAIILIITYIRTEQIVKISDVITSQVVFYKDGFNMIKMQLANPWMIVIYTYIIGLAISLRKLYFINNKRKILFNKYAMIFTLSILGIGVFSYYQGRSHDEVFPVVTYPFIMLVGIFTEILTKRIKIINKIQISNIALDSINILLISALALNTIISLAASKNIYFNMDKEKLKTKTILEDYSNYDIANIEFITQYESLYYNKYNLKDKKKMPARVDLFKYSDLEKVVTFLEQTDKNVVIDKNILNIIKSKKEYDIISDKFTIDKENKFNVVLINNKNMEE